MSEHQQTVEHNSIFGLKPQNEHIKNSNTDEPTKPKEENLLEYWGIRFSKSGQVFFFLASNFTVRLGTRVLVELEHGAALGEVAKILKNPERPIPENALGYGKIIRMASASDVAIHAENQILAAEANAFCKTCITQRKLDMKLVNVEVMHDLNKIIFFFTAPSRIDFRELVKDLVSNYRTRIELRQIGVRHETQMVGGIGNCGAVCCCHTYLRKFAPVAIKMAKEQSLFLNPSKLSGMCGRLLCCLSFEQPMYEDFNNRCPRISKKYSTDEGNYKVVRSNMLNDSITIVSDSYAEREITLADWEKLNPKRLENNGNQNDTDDADQDLLMAEASLRNLQDDFTTEQSSNTQNNKRKYR